jgi:hypothetical protein
LIVSFVIDYIDMIYIFDTDYIDMYIFDKYYIDMIVLFDTDYIDMMYLFDTDYITPTTSRPISGWWTRPGCTPTTGVSAWTR